MSSEEDEPKFIDIFPTDITKQIKPLDHPETLKAFKKIYNKRPVHACNVILKNEKLYFHRIRQWNDQLLAHFAHTGKDSYQCNEFRPESVLWDHISKRLKRTIFGKKNTDVRMCFCLNTNTFLVKAYFTFGLRLVMPDTWHIIQTSTVPIIFYHLPVNRNTKKASQVLRSFKCTDQFFYDQYKLEPHSVYKVPATIRYTLMTVQKTLFSLYIIEKNAFIPFRVKNPLEKKIVKKKVDLYSRMPMTPALDQLKQQEDEEMPPPPPPPPPPQQQQVYLIFPADNSTTTTTTASMPIINLNEPTLDEPSTQTIDEPSAQTIDEPSAQTMDEPSAQTIDEPSAQTMDEPSAQTMNEPSVETLDDGPVIHLEKNIFVASIDNLKFHQSLKHQVLGPIETFLPNSLQLAPIKDFEPVKEIEAEPMDLTNYDVVGRLLDSISDQRNDPIDESVWFEDFFNTPFQ